MPVVDRWYWAERIGVAVVVVVVVVVAVGDHERRTLPAVWKGWW